MPESPVVSFYRGTGSDHMGRRLEEILTWDDAELESVHDYIQWLFPNDVPSRANSFAPLLTADDRATFRADPALRATLQRCFLRILSFYGLERVEQGDTIAIRPSNRWTERARNLAEPAQPQPPAADAHHEVPEGARPRRGGAGAPAHADGPRGAHARQGRSRARRSNTGGRRSNDSGGWRLVLRQATAARGPARGVTLAGAVPSYSSVFFFFGARLAGFGASASSPSAVSAFLPRSRFGRGADAASDSLWRRPALGIHGFSFRLRAWIELAANQLDLGDFRRVAPAKSDPEQPRVPARPFREPRRQVVEQLGDDRPILHVAHDQTPCVEGLDGT